MKITLPSSREKHYLTGMDWIIHALDYSARKRLGHGTPFQIVMELSGELERRGFEKSFSAYCERFPHLNGKVSRDWNLAPYWKPRSTGRSFELKWFAADNIQAAYEYLENELNQPVMKENFPLRAVYVGTPQKKLLGFIFDHRLFDARGAERFLHGFQSFYLGNAAQCEVKLVPAPAHLDQWSEKFAAGKKVNRVRISQETNSKIQTLKQPEPFKGALNRFKTRTFDEKQTQTILDRAGPFMFLPYSLALSLQGVAELFSRRGGVGGDLAVSVTRDMRPSYGQTLRETFFNHLSFMFFRVKAPETRNSDLLLASLKNQFYEQIKNKIPDALAEASMLMRIVPLALLSQALQTREHAPASFSFASLGESAYQYTDFMTIPVERLFHMPCMPPSPGLGIFFSQYKKRLTLTLSYLDSLIAEEEAASMMSRLSLC